MRAWRVGQPGPMRSGPLVADECPDPLPGPGEVLVRVRVCGVCRTDLHLAEGDLPPRAARRRSRARGGRWVDRRPGAGATRFAPGDRVGVAWLRQDLRHLPLLPARRGEPLPRPRVHRLGRRRRLRRVRRRAGGLRLPAARRASTTRSRPLLCAGSSATAPCAAPSCRRAGGSASTASAARAHLAAQIALGQGARVHVHDPVRGRRVPSPSSSGAASAGGAERQPPEPLDSAILFAPAGGLVPVALRRPGPGRHARRRRHPPERHSAAATTPARPVPGAPAAQRHRQHAGRRRGVLGARGGHPAAPHHGPYPFAAADRALLDLSEDRVTGAAVLRMDAP